MKPQCNGICVTALEVGLPYAGMIAYPHPECELHGWEGEDAIPEEALSYDIGEEPHSFYLEEEI